MVNIKQKNKYYLKTYGITYAEFFKKASKGCKICSRTTGRICQDHIHVKGFKNMSAEEKRKYLRGALCFICNTAIGKLERTNDGKLNRLRLNGIVEYFNTYVMKGES